MKISHRLWGWMGRRRTRKKKRWRCINTSDWCVALVCIFNLVALFAYRGRQRRRHLRAIWYTTLPNARGARGGKWRRCLMGGWEGRGADTKRARFTKSYQCTRTPPLMPCRYGRDTADIWGRICEEGRTTFPDSNLDCCTLGIAVVVFQHCAALLCECSIEQVVVSPPPPPPVFAGVVYLFCGPSPTRYSTTLSTRPRSLGGTGLARGGPGGCIPGKTQHTLP